MDEVVTLFFILSQIYIFIAHRRLWLREECPQCEMDTIWVSFLDDNDDLQLRYFCAFCPYNVTPKIGIVWGDEDNK